MDSNNEIVTHREFTEMYNLSSWEMIVDNLFDKMTSYKEWIRLGLKNNEVLEFNPVLTTWEYILSSPITTLEETIDLLSGKYRINKSFTMIEKLTVIIAIKMLGDDLNIEMEDVSLIFEDIKKRDDGSRIVEYSQWIYRLRNTTNYMLVVYLVSRIGMPNKSIENIIKSTSEEENIKITDLPNYEQYHFSEYSIDLPYLIVEYYSNMKPGPSVENVHDAIERLIRLHRYKYIDINFMVQELERYHSKEIADYFDLPAMFATRLDLLCLIRYYISTLGIEYRQDIPVIKYDTAITFTNEFTGLKPSEVIQRRKYSAIIGRIIIGMYRYNDGTLSEDYELQDMVNVYDRNEYLFEFIKSIESISNSEKIAILMSMVCYHMSIVIIDGIYPENPMYHVDDYTDTNIDFYMRSFNDWRIYKLRKLFNEIESKYPIVGTIPVFTPLFADDISHTEWDGDNFKDMDVNRMHDYFFSDKYMRTTNVYNTIYLILREFNIKSKVYEQYLIAITKKLELYKVPGKPFATQQLYTGLTPEERIEYTLMDSESQRVLVNIGVWLVNVVLNDPKYSKLSDYTREMITYDNSSNGYPGDSSEDYYPEDMYYLDPDERPVPEEYDSYEE